MGPENNVGLGGCRITECLLPYLCMVTVPHIMVGLERMLDYTGVGLARFHCICIICTYVFLCLTTTNYNIIHIVLRNYHFRMPRTENFARSQAQQLH